MGSYKQLPVPINGFPAWRLESREVTNFLFRNRHGFWIIGDELLKDSSVISSKESSESPFKIEWKYRDEKNKKWDVDKSLTVSPSKL